MSYLSLYRKWRPGTFADVLGQAHVTETLTSALRDKRVSHAYLFAGPRGCGKTSTARILAKALNCVNGVTPEPCGECDSCRQITDGTSLDVFEMDAASHTSVDDVREIREKIPFVAVSGTYKVYIIDEAHQLSRSAFDALLKMLEEPPGHVVFVLCTTESHRLPATVMSRCQRFEFRRLSVATLAGHLSEIANKEGVEAEVNALTTIARHAHGSARDALSLLDQAAGTSGDVTLEAVLDIMGDAPEDVLLQMGDAIASGDVLGIFRLVELTIERGWDPRQLLRQMIDHVRALFLTRRGAEELLDVDEEYRTKLREQAHKMAVAHLEWALRVLGEAQADVRWSTHPRLPLEIAMARAATPETEDPRTLLARVERLERALLTGGPPADAVTRTAPASAVPRPAPAEVAAPAPVHEPAPVHASPPVREPAPAPVQGPEPAEAPAPSAGAPPPSEPPPPAAPPSGGSLEEIWPVFLQAVQARKRTAHVNISQGWPVSMSDAEIVVGFEREVFVSNLLRPDLIPHLTSAAEEVFGRKLRIRPQHLPGKRPDGRGEPVDQPARSPIELVKERLDAEIVDEVDEVDEP